MPNSFQERVDHHRLVPDSLPEVRNVLGSLYSERGDAHLGQCVERRGKPLFLVTRIFGQGHVVVETKMMSRIGNLSVDSLQDVLDNAFDAYDLPIRFDVLGSIGNDRLTETHGIAHWRIPTSGA